MSPIFAQACPHNVDILSSTIVEKQSSYSYMSVRRGAEGPLFRFKDGRLPTRECFVSRVRDALSSAGIDESLFAGHSFRIGACSYHGSPSRHPRRNIQLLGRWKSTAYLLYIKTPRDQLASVSQTLSKTV